LADSSESQASRKYDISYSLSFVAV
jgi:hypothetical protein